MIFGLLLCGLVCPILQYSWVGNILRVITRTLEKVFINCINAHNEMEKQERENLGKLNTHLEAAENRGSSNHQDLILFEFRKKSGEEKYKDRDS